MHLPKAGGEPSFDEVYVQEKKKKKMASSDRRKEKGSFLGPREV